MDKADIGVAGLGVMGHNLAMNMERNGYTVTGYDLDARKIQFLLENPASASRFQGAHTPGELMNALKKPRRVLMMVPAGPPVDAAIAQFKPHMEPGDILIDGGNSFFEDTEKRSKQLAEEGFHFVGMGVSGGEEGARHGPSLMPGGSKEAYEHLKPILESIAAKSDSGPCVTHCGPDGAGHFVKMVHNGIEYGDMQLIAEAYDLLRKALGLTALEIADIFAQWNSGVMESYLVEITSQVLTAIDPQTNKPLVDQILDKAGQKGTGKWTAQVALDLAVPIPTIAAAIDARVLSSMKDERMQASKVLGSSQMRYSGDKKQFITAIHDALYAAKICSYAQGMSLIRAGSNEWNWNISLREMARIWKAGCIIRARLLDSIMKAFDRNSQLPNLLLDDEFKKAVRAAEGNWRKVISSSVELGIPVPAMSASLAYFDSYRSSELPQNLTQAQRDFFGAHTYQRKDDPQGKAVHTEWTSLIRKTGGK